MNSRYYNPEWGRFINADDVGILAADGELLENNLFAYCLNNPVNMTDDDGYLPKWAKWVAAAVVVTAVVTVAILAAPTVMPMLTAAAAKISVAASCAYLKAGVAYTMAGWRASAAVSKYGGAIWKGTKGLLSKGFGKLSHGSKYGISSYSNLVTKLKGTGLEAHHIVEQRLARALGITNSRSMLSVAVTKSEHQVFTNLWRRYIPYGTNYDALSKDYIWSIAQKVYKGYPALLEAAKKTIY